MIEFAELGVNVIVNAKVLKINQDSLEYEVTGNKEVIPCDASVLATGQKSFGGELHTELREKGYKVTVIGDALIPGKIMGAVKAGNNAAYAI